MQDRNDDLHEGTKLRTVRRRLFQEGEENGDESARRNGENGEENAGDEENFANSLFEEMRQHREEAKRRWNFDFEREQPLPGNYEWVKVDKEGNEIPMAVEMQEETNEIVERIEGVEEEEEEKEEKNKVEEEVVQEKSRDSHVAADVSR